MYNLVPLTVVATVDPVSANKRGAGGGGSPPPPPTTSYPRLITKRLPFSEAINFHPRSVLGAPAGVNYKPRMLLAGD